MPVNIAFAGGNACNHRVDLQRLNDSQLTTPKLLPRVAENANKTLIVGSSHFVHFSLAP